MTNLPDPTPPFSEGGPPQSELSPGDAYRELIHEVRNLSTQVALLHTIFVKRKVLYWILGIETFIVVAVLTTFGILLGIQKSNQDAFINRSYGSCQIRNSQVDATRAYLATQLQIQQESQGLNAAVLSQLHLQFTAAQQQEILKLTALSQKALQDYLAKQPNDVNCKAIK